MKMNAKKMGLAVFLAVGSVLAGETKAASTVDLTFVNVSAGVSNAGVFNWSQTGKTGVLPWANPLATSTDVNTFCIELVQYTGTWTYDVNDLGSVSAPVPGSLLTANKVYLLNQLWNYNIDTTHVFPGPATTDGRFNGTLDAHAGYTANQVAAAFQHAVWEIVNESDANIASDNLALGSGSFINYNASGDVFTLANTMLTELNMSTGFTSNWSLYSLTNSSGQDQITAVLAPNSTSTPPIPSPVAVGLGFIGFAMLGLRRQREIV